MTSKKTWFRIFGLVAGLLLSGCLNLIEDEDDGAGNLFDLFEDTWTNGNITQERQVREYSIIVNEGTYYFIWWNDSYSGNGTKTTDVYVSAQYNGGSSIFTRSDSAWSTLVSFTASRNGIVTLSVSGGVGTYAVAYRTANSRP
jgi:hypothetical protein